MDIAIRSSRVAARRRHAAEKPGGSATFAEQERRNDLAKSIAAAAAAAGSQVPTISRELLPLSFDQCGVPGESTLEFLDKLSIRIAIRVHYSSGAALRRLPRAISYSIWSDQALAVLARQPTTGQRLPIRRLLYLLDFSYFDNLTVSRRHVNVYKVFTAYATSLSFFQR
jgi:hypothetical protein